MASKTTSYYKVANGGFTHRLAHYSEGAVFVGDEVVDEFYDSDRNNLADDKTVLEKVSKSDYDKANQDASVTTEQVGDPDREPVVNEDATTTEQDQFDQETHTGTVGTGYPA